MAKRSSCSYTGPDPMITLVTNIRQLVTPCGSGPAAGTALGDLRVLDRHVLVLRDERIAAVEPEARAPRADRVIDAGGGVVVPGLVDPCVTASPETSDDGGAAALRAALETMLRHGTTSSEVRATAGPGGDGVEDLLSDLQQLAHRVPLRLSTAFLGTPRGTSAVRGDTISGLIGETIPSLSRRRLAAACVIATGSDGYGRKEARSLLRAARGAGLACKVQATGADGEAYLAAADCEALSVDHLPAGLPPARPLAQLRKVGTIAVLLPSRLMLGECPGPTARDAVSAGLPIALGSAADLFRGGAYSMWTAVALAVRRLGLTVAEALTASTLNGAAAIGAAHHAGTLEPGKNADFVILDIDDIRRVPDFIVGLPIRSVFVGGKDAAKP